MLESPEKERRWEGGAYVVMVFQESTMDATLAINTLYHAFSFSCKQFVCWVASVPSSSR